MTAGELFGGALAVDRRAAVPVERHDRAGAQVVRRPLARRRVVDRVLQSTESGDLHDLLGGDVATPPEVRTSPGIARGLWRTIVATPPFEPPPQPTTTSISAASNATIVGARNRSSSRRSLLVGRPAPRSRRGWLARTLRRWGGLCRYSTPRPLARIPAWPPRARPRRSAPARRPAPRTSSPTVITCAGFAVAPLTRTCPARHAAPAAERVLVRRIDQIQESTPSGHAVSGPRGDGC